MTTLTTPIPSTSPIDTLSACPVCDGTDLRPLQRPGHWIGGEAFAALRGDIGLARCGDCGLTFTNPRPSEAELRNYYAGNTYICHETAGSASAGTKARYVLDRIERHLPPHAPRTLLDYGAGGGGFLLFARNRGWECQGFEPGRRGLDTCRGLGLDVTDDLDEIPSGQYGLITLHHVLEHIATPVDALRDLKRFAAPGGRLFVEVPNAGSLRARLAAPVLSRRFGVDERYRAFPIHLMYYTESTLRAVLRQSGWEVDAMFTMGLGMDEFFARSSEGQRSDREPVRADSNPTAKRRLRHIVRDAFLGRGLGENLAAICHPAR